MPSDVPANLRLEPPSGERFSEYLSMIENAAARGEDGAGYYMIDTAAARADPAGHIRRLLEMERGVNLPEGWVPMSTRWLIQTPQDNAGAHLRQRSIEPLDVSHGGLLAGEVRIRHRLSPTLEVEGGHVGYFIHPDFRGRGYGKAILALALRELGRLGVHRVLVTCNVDNMRSRRVIERNGGVFDRYTLSPKSGKQVMRYWVENAAKSFP